jgi:hypothetical protein
VKTKPVESYVELDFLALKLSQYVESCEELGFYFLALKLKQ